MLLLLRRGLLTIALLLLTVDMALGGELRERFYQDFRGGRWQGAVFRKAGRNASEQIRPESAGLRITLPAAPTSWPQTGLMPRFQLHGDFAITLTYELLAVEPPPSKGYGSGVMIWAGTGQEPGSVSVSIARRYHPKEKDVYAVHRAINKGKGQTNHKGQLFPTASRAGKLRLQRTGETIHYLVADEGDDSFRELQQESFTTADVTAMRIMADPGGGTGKLDVLLKDLRFESEQLPLVGTPRQTRNWWLWLGVAALLGTVIAAACVVMRKRLARRRVSVAVADGKASVHLSTASSAPSGARRPRGDLG